MFLANRKAMISSKGEAAAPASYYVGTVDDTSDLGEYTFSSADIGTAHSTRLVVVAVMIRGVGGFGTVTVTIGGDAASETVQVVDIYRAGASIHQLEVASGTTADIVVTFDGTATGCAVSVHALYDLASSTAKDTDTDLRSAGDDWKCTTEISVDSGDYVVTCFTCNATQQINWTKNASGKEDYDENITGTGRESSASSTTTSTDSTYDIESEGGDGGQGAQVTASWA